VTEPGVEPTSSGCITGDRTTDLKSSAVMIGTGIHRLIYWDICVAATAHNRRLYIYIYVSISILHLEPRIVSRCPSGRYIERHDKPVGDVSIAAIHMC